MTFCRSARLARQCMSWPRKSAARSAREDWKRPRMRARQCARADTTEMDKKAAGFATAQGGLHLRAAAGRAVPRSAAALHLRADISRHAGIRGRRACRAHDGHGFGHQQRF